MQNKCDDLCFGYLLTPYLGAAPPAKKIRAVNKKQAAPQADAAATERAQTETSALKPSESEPCQATASEKENASPHVAGPALYIGKFDLYSTKLKFLTPEYLPQGATKPDFYRLYKKLLFFQAKPDYSMRIDLHDDGGPSAKTGRFSCPNVANPMSDEPFKPIMITRGQAKIVSFDRSEAVHSTTAGSGPGYVARLELDASRAGCSMLSSAKGNFKMHRVWEGEHEGCGVELFEGIWDFHASHGPMLRRKGFGGSTDYDSAFWGIRALKDKEGKEIGIDEDEEEEDY